MKRLYGKWLINSFFIFIFLTIILTTLLYSYDERVSDENDKNNNNPKEDLETDNKTNNIDTKYITSYQINPENLTIEESDNSKIFNPEQWTYFLEKNFEEKFENIIIYNRIPIEKILSGKVLEKTFYRVKTNVDKQILKIEEYSINFVLKNFIDYNYDENKRLVKIQHYDNIATPIAKQVLNYNTSGELEEQIFYDENGKETKRYLYHYDGLGREIIRISIVLDKVSDMDSDYDGITSSYNQYRYNNKQDDMVKIKGVLERRYSYYNDLGKLSRREYYYFGTLYKIIQYDQNYTDGFINRKRVYNKQGDLLRTYHYSEKDNADSIFTSIYPGLIDYLKY